MHVQEEVKLLTNNIFSVLSITHGHLRMTMTFTKKQKACCRIVMAGCDTYVY